MKVNLMICKNCGRELVPQSKYKDSFMHVWNHQFGCDKPYTLSVQKLPDADKYHGVAMDPLAQLVYEKGGDTQ